jgi:hypothetical protein
MSLPGRAGRFWGPKPARWGQLSGFPSRAPVDLDELAKALPTFPNLERLPGAPPPGPPQPEPNPYPPNRPLRHPEAFNLAKLLARQRRAKIAVARHQRRLDRSQPRRIEPIVRGPPAPARHHAPRALASGAANQPLHLANPDSQKLPSPNLPQLSPQHTPRDLKPLPLRPAHRQNIPVQTGPLPLPQKGTFNFAVTPACRHSRIAL